MKKNNRWVALFVSAICVISASACAGNNQASVFPGTADENMVIMDISAEPAELNPILLRDGISVEILRHCMAGIARLDQNDKPVPDVAERWEANEDNTAHTVYLRKDAKWSNGDPVTAQDFYDSWVMQMTPSTGTIYAEFLYKNIKNGLAFYEEKLDASALGLEVIDDYTLRIEWSHPMMSAEYFFAFPVYFPINRAAYEQIGAEQYAKNADAMVTNGPYRISEWVHDNHILLEKSDDYQGSATADIPKIKLLMIGDDNTRLNAFMAGELDICNLYNEQISQVKAQDENAVGSFIDGGSWYFCFNTQNEYLSNVNLRRALAYSVDVQSLLDEVINDGSVAADGLVPHVIAGVDNKPYADARGELFAFDPEKGKDYFNLALQELGLTAQELKLELLANDTSYSKMQAEYLKQQWKERLGLEVDIRALSWKARVETQKSGDFAFFVEGWAPSENDAITFLENYLSDSGTSFSKYSNPAYDKFVKDAIAQGDPAARQALLIEAEKILIDEMVIGPLYFTSTTYAVSNKVEGLVRTPFQLFSFCGGAKIKAD